MFIERHKNKLLVAALAGLITLAGIVAAFPDGDKGVGSPDTPASAWEIEQAGRDRGELVEVVRKCGSPGGATIGDGGKTLIIDGNGEMQFVGSSTDDIVCILGLLNVPDSVVEIMSHTSALDGRQQGSWNGYTASWTYHPKNGLDIVVTQS